MGDEFFGKDNHNDPIESAGLFEGDIDNVYMNGLFKIKGLKVSANIFFHKPKVNIFFYL